MEVVTKAKLQCLARGTTFVFGLLTGLAPNMLDLGSQKSANQPFQHLAIFLSPKS